MSSRKTHQPNGHASRKVPAAKFTQDNSVSLGTIAGVDLRLTPSNTLFVLYNKQIAWPYLRNGSLQFDVVEFQVPQAAATKIISILVKQAEIREKNPLDFDEDEAQYTYW